jgi:hypothetical protein
MAHKPRLPPMNICIAAATTATHRFARSEVKQHPPTRKIALTGRSRGAASSDRVGGDQHRRDAGPRLERSLLRRTDRRNPAGQFCAVVNALVAQDRLDERKLSKRWGHDKRTSDTSRHRGVRLHGPTALRGVPAAAEPARRISSAGRARSDGGRTPDPRARSPEADLHLEFTSGATGHVWLSWLASGTPMDIGFRVMGDRRRASIQLDMVERAGVL